MYAAVVGSLLYTATVTRPDIAYAAAALARYLSKPTKELLDSAMHVVKYMKYTEQFKLVFGGRRNAKPVELYGLPSAPSFPALAYGDADYANCVEMRRSVTGIVITLDGTPVVWASRKQPTVTKSSTAAECVAASMTADDAILAQKILSDLGKPQKPVPLLCENTAAKCLLKNPIENGKTKYLDVHWHY
jgi:hypothetical protein